MRVIAAFFTLIMLAAVGLGGKALRDALIEPTPQMAPATIALAVAEVRDAPQSRSVGIRWPALFGEPLPPAPPAPPAPVVVEEKQPPAPPRPPLSSLGYQLKGVVRAGDAVWGLVSHPTGDQIMRVGDAIAEGMVVARIDEAGLWVDIGEDAPVLLGFVE
jgi:hypothetical protein